MLGSALFLVFDFKYKINQFADYISCRYGDRMIDTFLSLIITAVLLLASPGPVPIALAAAGATVGFRKGLLFMFGMLTGLSLVILMTFLGLSTLFTQFPIVSYIFILLSSLFLFYIAYKLATSKTLISTHNQRVLTYKTGFIINILNPKAYAAMVALLTQFTQAGNNSSYQLVVAGLIIFAIAVIADVVWLAIGRAIQPLFNNVKYQQWIRYLFAGALTLVVALNLVKVFMG